MSIYAISYESNDKSNYGVFTVYGKDKQDAYNSAVRKMKREKKAVQNYKITVHDDD